MNLGSPPPEERKADEGGIQGCISTEKNAARSCLGVAKRKETFLPRY